MAYLCIVINTPNDSIAELNAEVQVPTKPHEAVELCAKYLAGILAGTKDSSVQLTSRDSDPSISTSGSGSQQNTYSLL